jgi:[acyl-carrier-protein] S-malonyltransferase
MSNTFIFPGQGSQKVGMGKDFYDFSSIAKERFEECNKILGRDLVSIIFNGPEDELTQTNNTQPALFMVEAIICDLLKEKGITPQIVAGHSLGEYSALYAAGVFSFSDGLRITAKRGELMMQAGRKYPGSMAAIIGLRKKEIEEVLSNIEGTVVCANENSPEQIVISGEKEAVEKACIKCKEKGAKRAVTLAVSGAFHSPLMAPVAEEFKTFLEPFTFFDPSCQVVLNVTGLPENSGKVIKNMLVTQLTSPVKWVDTVNYISKYSFCKIYEIGPGNVLAGLVKKCNLSLNVIPCGTLENVFSITKLKENYTIFN